MDNYLESVAGLLSASPPLLKDGIAAPMLPLQATGTANGDLLMASGNVSALAGNDIIIATGTGTVLDGGVEKTPM
jgi:hypothetical protein